MASASISKDLTENDLVILARHLSRVSGFISYKTLADHLPNLETKTTLRILRSLLASGHVQRGKAGFFTFVDPTGDMETGDLEEELSILEDVKKKVAERHRADATSNVLVHEAVEDLVQEKPESDEESTTPRRKHDFGTIKSFRAFHDAALEHGLPRRRKSYTPPALLEIPLNLEKLRKSSLDESLFSTSPLKSFHHSTPENRKFKHKKISLKLLTRRRSSAEKKTGSSSEDSEENPSGSEHFSPPELNKTIYPEDDSLTLEFLTPSSELATGITRPGSSEATSSVESANSTTCAADLTSGELAPMIAALDLGSTEGVVPTAASDRHPDLVQAEETPAGNLSVDATEKTGSEAAAPEPNDSGCTQEFNSSGNQSNEPIPKPRTISSPEAPQESLNARADEEPGATESQHPDQLHRTEEETGEGVHDPCKALEDFCRSVHLEAPAYNLTFMPMQRVYYSTLLVNDTSFLSHPTESYTERGAKEVVAEEALKFFGITANMVSTGVFPNPRRKMQTGRSDAETQGSSVEP